MFAVSALRGPRYSPYGLIFAHLIAPRLDDLRRVIVVEGPQPETRPVCGGA